jgi:HD-GYP domain-containing protein (c-di-GMP phosphodiesterase class II)
MALIQQQMLQNYTP